MINEQSSLINELTFALFASFLCGPVSYRVCACLPELSQRSAGELHLNYLDKRLIEPYFWPPPNNL
jgi:hypothetical protein